MRRFGLVLAWLLVASLSAGAQEVWVGGQVVMRLDSAQAAEAVTARIDSLLSRGAEAGDIRTVKVADGWAVVWGDVRLVTVDPGLAAANQSLPEALAGRWAANLRQAVGPGLLRVSPSRVVLPVGGETVIQLQGLAKGEVTYEGADGFVEVSQGESGDELVLTARAVGKIRLVLRRDKGTAAVSVHVKDWAGYPPAQARVEVTGHPAPGSMVAQAALTAVVDQTRVNPGCRLEFDGPVPDLPSVPSGQTLKFGLPIKIVGGDDYYPVQKKVPVEVTSLELEPAESNLLLVSNRPERVDQDGVLMEYVVARSETCRLMYSHLNESAGARNLWVNLLNPGDAPLRVLVGWTFAGPNRNEVHTGHMAAVRFLDALGKEAGFVVTVPARGKYELASHLMGRQDLVSGFVNLRILDGEKMGVEVLSALVPSRNDSRGMARLGGPFNPFKIHPHGVFAQPFFEEWVDVQPGQEPVKVPYGKSPWLIDFETGLPNTGNFGVLYRYNLVFTNPTPRAATFDLIFHPTSGPAAGTFLVDGEVREAGFRRKGVPEVIGQFRIAPGEERTVNVVTFPEASSNYPAHLEVREMAQ